MDPSFGEWDVIVVGAGTAGCVVAERLSRDPAVRVLLIESGPDGPTASADLFASLSALGRLWPDVKARRSPLGPVRVYPRGRGIGGSGSVNGLLDLRPTGGDLDRWASVGLALDTSVQRTVAQLPTSKWGPADRALAMAGHAAGLPLVRRARVDQAGIGAAPLHARFDVDRQLLRASTDVTHLGPARQRPNLAVLPDTDVIELTGATTGAVSGVRAETANGPRTISAPLTVVCAGSIHTPALLLRSGLARPGLGRNLADHAAIGVTLHLRGPAPAATPTTCALGHTAGGLQLLPLNRLGTTDELRMLGGLLIGVLDNRGRGSVSIDEAGRPVPEFDLLGDPHDRAEIVRATRLLFDIASRPEVRAEATHVSIDERGTPLADAIGMDDRTLNRWIEQNMADYVHATGTCAFGSSEDPSAVVGPGGVVHGTTGVAVIDASVFPTPPRVNPWRATVMLASALADDLAALQGGYR